VNNKVAQYIDSIKSKNIHVIGASGAEGAAIINFLYSHGVKNITAHDFQPDLSAFRKRFKQTNATLTPKQRASILKNIINQDVKICLKDQYLQNLNQAELIFLTQAWYIYPPNFPHVTQAIKQNIPITSITKLYFDLAPCPIIGITGSQGKSTTTTLVTKFLDQSGSKVYTGGNIRDMYDQLLNSIEQITPQDFIVLEISNRQLTIDLGHSPHIAVITNITPNHIEEHGSFSIYKKVKQSLLKYQTANDFSVLNYDNPVTKKLITKYDSQKILFSTKYHTKGPHIENNQIIFNNEPLISLDQIQLVGEHNLSNILAALGAISPLHLPKKHLITVLQNFSGIPHRLQLVANINNVRYIDDLKSSTPTATIVAIKAINNHTPLHLIVGGNHKEVSYAKLAKLINQKVTSLLTLPGTVTNEIIKELQKLNSPITIYQFENIFDCINKAQDISISGDTVLLSPAGAEFQQMHLENKYTLKTLLTKRT
jgi:UDP-N-acetylmuramoylalanine--D-glutamate ligase